MTAAEDVDTAYLIAAKDKPRLAEIASAMEFEAQRILSIERVVCKGRTTAPNKENVRRAVCFDEAAALINRILGAVDRWPRDVKLILAGKGPAASEATAAGKETN